MKIFIIGISGSGKSTLAKDISKILKIPHFDLDDIFWIKRYTDKRNKEECLLKLKEILKLNNEWIIEGVYHWGKIAANTANVIIWLDYGINTATIRVIKRWFKRKGEKKESIKDLYNLIKYIRAYRKIRPNKTRSTFEKHSEIVSENQQKLVKIKNKKNLKELLKKLEKNEL